MKPNEYNFVMDFEKGLGTRTFHEALSLCKANFMNEIRTREEKHFKSKEIARDKGFKEI
jgi:hypothetical protein